MSWSFPLLFCKFLPAWPVPSDIPLPSRVIRRAPITVTSALCVRPGTYESACGCRVPLLMDQWRYFPSCPHCQTRVDWVWQGPERQALTRLVGTRTQSAPRSTAPQGALSDARAAANVLLIDDRADTRAALRSILERAGYAIQTAHNGRDGLAKLQAGSRPRVIVLNLRDDAAADFQRAQLGSVTAVAYIPVIVCSGVFGPQPAEGAPPADLPLRPETVLALVRLFCPADPHRVADAMGLRHERGAQSP